MGGELQNRQFGGWGCALFSLGEMSSDEFVITKEKVNSDESEHNINPQS